MKTSRFCMHQASVKGAGVAKIIPMTPSPFETTLLLEDDPGHAMLIQRVLKEYSKEITHVSTLQAALKSLKAKTPSLIITDLHVPDGKELQIVEKLLSHAQGTPMLVLTSSTSLSIAVEAMKLGARDYIVKNFSSDFKDVFGLSIQRTARAVQMDIERKRLQHEMAVLRIAIENGLDCLAIVDTEGTITYSNSAFQEVVNNWGGSTANIHQIFSDKVLRAKELSEGIQSRLSGEMAGGFWTTEILFTEDKQSAYRLELGSIFGRDDAIDRGSPEWVLWIRDISNEKRREKFQREILSTTTHDLKGPLGAIILSSELITTKPEDQKRVKDLAVRISSSAHGAVNLIDEFLSARQIQEGTFILKPTPQNVSGLLDETVESYQPIATAKSIALTAELSSNEMQCSFDRLGMLRVLGNLLTNALKFTPKEGAVTLTASETADEIRINVSDTGSGMEPHEVKKLFERFSRLSKHSDVAGTGLGLFVVKCIVTAHGGTLDVSSTVGSGTTFSITLPKKPPTNQNGELISLDFA